MLARTTHRPWPVIVITATVVACTPAATVAPASAVTAAGTPATTRAATSAAEDSIRRIAASLGGQLAVAARHVESGRELSVNGDAPTFTSSVVKLPLSVQMLDRVDRGEARLDDSIRLRVSDYRVGHSPLAQRWPEGTTVTLRELLRYALSESDNSASDALLRLSGGPSAVTARLAALGVGGIRVDRGYLDYVLDFTGTRLPPGEWLPQAIDSITGASPQPARDSAHRAFASDVRDRATPRALVNLLTVLARGSILSDSSRALLLGIMTATNNPRGRLVAGVPAGVAVAHKTGTWGGRLCVIAVNDVGLIRLPDGSSVAIAVMASGQTRPVAEIEAAMAAATRVVYDWAAR